MSEKFDLNKYISDYMENYGVEPTYEKVVNKALEQAQVEIEELKARMAKARKLVLADLKDSPNCECGADNGSNYTDVICYRHAAIMELND
jgi:hypothetical protein